MRPSASARSALAAVLLAALGCDRTPVQPDGPEGAPALAADYYAALGRPDARFFSPGLPDAPCERASLALRFADDTIALRCEVVQGIVALEYVDAGPMAVDLRGERLTARSESGFSFDGTLAPDSSRIRGDLHNGAGRSIGLTVVAW